MPFLRLLCSTLNNVDIQPMIFVISIVLVIGSDNPYVISLISIFWLYNVSNNGRLYPLCSKFFFTILITGFTARFKISEMYSSFCITSNSNDIEIVALLWNEHIIGNILLLSW